MSVTDSDINTPKKRGRKPRVIGKMPPVYTEDEIVAFADDLVSMAKGGQINIMEDFYKKHLLYRGQWGIWKSKYPYVKWAHDVAKECLASKGYDAFPECPARGALLMKTQHGWSDIEEIAEQVHKVTSYTELKNKINASK